LAPQPIVTVGTTVSDVLPPKLRVRDVVKSFPVRRREPVVAIDGIDISVDAGEFVCVVGASGCGKSTLLNIIAGLEPATAGSVEVDGELVVGPGPDRGVVFQSYTLYPWKNVRENIAFGLECAGRPKGERDERIDELLGVMELTRWQERLPRELSGGMRQRVAIARALGPQPDVLLLDEPFGALDAQTRLSMQEFALTMWQRTGTTVVMVTHDVEEALYVSQRIVVLTSHPGRVSCEIDVPFGATRGPEIKRDARFLDLRDEIQDLLVSRLEPAA
jgi:NitT/TauT family transport system ATP-binding protein